VTMHPLIVGLVDGMMQRCDRDPNLEPLMKFSNQYQGTTSDDKGVGKCSDGCLKSAKRSLEDSS
jgi:hypothetical protein